jgi:hypothetical protein
MQISGNTVACMDVTFSESATITTSNDDEEETTAGHTSTATQLPAIDRDSLNHDNGQHLHPNQTSPSTPHRRRSRRHSLLERLVRLGVPKSEEELGLIKQGNYSEAPDLPYVAARIAVSLLRHCLLRLGKESDFLFRRDGIQRLLWG